MAAASIASAAARAAAPVAKAAAVGTVVWLAKKFGDKVADDGYEAVKNKKAATGNEKQSRQLAEDLARLRGWTYMRCVVDHAPRYVVFDDDKHPQAAFPPISGVSTPEELGQRFELKGFVPGDEQLIAPPPAKG